MSPKARLDDDSLEFLYATYYGALNAVAQATWITAYPPLIDLGDESEELKRARALANEYEQRIKRRLQEIKDSVTTPIPYRR